MLHVEIAARSEVGGRSRNEDDLRHGFSGPFCYAVLADGAGGHRGGNIASDMVVRMTALGLQSATQATPAYLTQLICDTHAAINEQQHGKQSGERMHATVVALWVDTRREEALWTHVGDSRLYMLRHGRVFRMTRDDSVVQRMVDAGYLTPEEAVRHPKKNQLLSAMGIESGVEPSTLPAPMPIEDGDAFLLCSDGWWDLFSNEMLEDFFAMAESADDWLERMGRAIRAADRPKQDNYSAIAVWVGDPSETTRMSGLWELDGGGGAP